MGRLSLVGSVGIGWVLVICLGEDKAVIWDGCIDYLGVGVGLWKLF